jgi:16S rRNA processing protein RimM
VDPAARPSHIAIARILRPWGNRGEVLAELHTDFPTRFSLLNRVWVEYPDKRRAQLEIASCREHQGRQVLKFGSIDSIGDAETLAGAWIEIEADQAFPLPKGTYWDHDLIGCVLRDGSGKTLGTVTDVMRFSGHHQLVVKDGNREFLVPVVAAICREISVARKEILVDLPEGLTGLNA